MKFNHKKFGGQDDQFIKTGLHGIKFPNDYDEVYLAGKTNCGQGWKIVGVLRWVIPHEQRDDASFVGPRNRRWIWIHKDFRLNERTRKHNTENN